MQFGPSGFEVNEAERLQPADLQLRKFYEHAAIASEALKVVVALQIQIRAHLLDLEIGHIAYAAAQGAFVAARPAELETLNQTPMRKHLPGRADNLAQAGIVGENTDDMGASGNPDNRLVFLGFETPVGINLEKLRMQRSLEKAECQLVDSYIDLR